MANDFSKTVKRHQKSESITDRKLSKYIPNNITVNVKILDLKTNSK